MQEEVAEWNDLARRASDLRDLVDLATEEDDDSFLTDVQADIERVTRDLDRSEFRLLFNGEYDANGAIVVSKRASLTALSAKRRASRASRRR